jgi:NhaP-type Na+/H+ or K+/H+ antiporter
MPALSSEPYLVVLLMLGAAILAIAWVPVLVRDLPLSLPIFCVAAGVLVFTVFDPAEAPLPILYPEITERLSELILIIALMGAGLKIDRPIGWRQWSITWRLLAVAMPLTILGVAGLGWWVMGLAPAAAVLLGAALAPTDPVLASDVQLGPPGTPEEGEVRFALTSEAGLNDGLAFPFTNLAIAMAAAGSTLGSWTVEWLTYDVVWKLGAGVVIGLAVGWFLGALVFRLPKPVRLARSNDGFVALGLTFVSYGLTELAHGYGFVAVFITAVTLRHHERAHDYHERLHDFSEQTERLLMLLLLVLFGGAIATGLLAPLTWPAAIAGLAIVFLVRPASALISLSGTSLLRGERGVISFFGIRGIGSIYYLAYAMNRADFGHEELLWATIGFVVLVSIVVHGVTVTPIMRRLDRSGRLTRLTAAASTGAGDHRSNARPQHRRPDQ